MIATQPKPASKPQRAPSAAWADRLGRTRSPWPYRRRLWIAATVAMGLHAAVYFSSRESVITAAEFAMGDPAPSLEMELVAGEEAAAEPEVTPEPAPPEPMPEPAPPEPTPPPEPEPIPDPEPVKEPEPMPEPAKEEMVEPKPEPPKPKPEPPKPRPKPVAKPAAPRPTAATSAPPTGAPAGAAASGAPGGTGRSTGGKSSGPGYLSNPKPPYPPESRAAGEQGLTQLRVMLDATGRPTSVSVSRSSGFSRLDAAALEGVRRWRFKPAMRDGQPIAAPTTVPIRWSLR